MNIRIYTHFVAALLCIASSAYAQSNKVERQRQFEPAIQAFEEADKTNPPAKGGVLFIGSSSITLWKSLADDFPGARAMNRGFGGSHIEDSVDFAHRIVFPGQPRLIVLYAGDNDHAGIWWTKLERPTG
jgi:hypothetical protein